MSGLSLRDRQRSLVIGKVVGVELLLLQMERSQLWWYRHLTRMCPGYLQDEL